MFLKSVKKSVLHEFRHAPKKTNRFLVKARVGRGMYTILPTFQSALEAVLPARAHLQDQESQGFRPARRRGQAQDNTQSQSSG